MRYVCGDCGGPGGERRIRCQAVTCRRLVCVECYRARHQRGCEASPVERPPRWEVLVCGTCGMNEQHGFEGEECDYCGSDYTVGCGPVNWSDLSK